MKQRTKSLERKIFYLFYVEHNRAIKTFKSLTWFCNTGTVFEERVYDISNNVSRTDDIQIVRNW